MSEMKQKIITVDAKAFFKYFPKEIAEDQKCFTLKYANRALYKLVVQQENEMEDCPLFYQFFKEIEKSWNSQSNDKPFKITNTTLLDKFVIVDFGDIFLPLDEISAFPGQKERHEDYLENAKDIVEKGFDIYFENHEKPVHMIAFDKSGNMSRHSRISFIDENYYAGLNTRLNLGMDFSKIPVKESKYYSYRGLYLSSSKRINHKKLIIDADTIVVLHDVRKDEKNPSKPITGYYYDKDITIATAKLDVEEDGSKEKINCTFLKTKREELLEVDIPFDGAGFISPEYASYINEALGTTGATSFQVRLPFMKGMLHEVDVHQFLEEYNIHKDGEENWYKDVFGKKRDLSKAHIFITESMFKGMKWLIKHLSNLEDNKYGHPMEFYCDTMNKYEHALYISGTNLPYGHSKFTHLSYQMINTLDFSKEQFSNVINHHCNYIENSIDFLKEWGNNNDNNVSNDYSKRDKIGLTSDIPNWKKAVFKNQKLKTDVYITKQLQNTQKGLLTKLAKGKILVEGQTRYLCRDLLPLLVSLLEKKKDILGFYPRYLYGRFYLPMEDYRELDKELHLNYNSYYAFFRSPHLSRNEQIIMQRFIDTDAETYIGWGEYEIFKEHLALYNKYFGKLTGIVMVPRGSVAPLCLGGADFDGDLVCVVFNQDVVNAVASGGYQKEKGVRKIDGKIIEYWERNISVVKIPASESPEIVPEKYVPFRHIENTFSNRIGQISNAAISIGQVEYGRNLKEESDEYINNKQAETVFESKEPSCEKCTLLTGLEIDAAKNGQHPNLDIILKTEIEKSPYLVFLKDFEKLRGEENYDFRKLSVERDKESLCISAKGCKKKAKFQIPAKGTYINELPVYFEKELKKYQLSKEKIKDTSSFFAYPRKISSEDKEKIEKFKEQCKMVLEYYFFYVQTFLILLKNEKKDKFYAPENLQTNLFQIYDEKNAIHIERTIVPNIKRKIRPYVDEHNTIKDMKDRMNEVQWLLQPYDNRGKALEQIIGNGFNESSLDEEEREVLYHFYQQGYKTLWLILTLIEGPKSQTFDRIKSRDLKKNEKISIPCEELDASLEQLVREFYENNITNVEDKIYRICINKLRKIIKNSDLDSVYQVPALYESTKNSDKARRFFWDAFKWKDIDPYIKAGDDIC